MLHTMDPSEGTQAGASHYRAGAGQSEHSVTWPAPTWLSHLHGNLRGWPALLALGVERAGDELHEVAELVQGEVHVEHGHVRIA